MRDLTSGEMAVLRQVQEIWGPQNRAEDVTFISDNEAVLFARNPAGEIQVLVHLSNLADWTASGELSHDQLRRWVSGPKAGPSGG